MYIYIYIYIYIYSIYKLLRSTCGQQLFGSLRVHYIVFIHNVSFKIKRLPKKVATAVGWGMKRFFEMSDRVLIFF